MALLNLPAKVMRLGFAQNFTSHSVSEVFSLNGTTPTEISISLAIPQQLITSSISFTLQMIPSTTTGRDVKAELKQGEKVLASYSTTSASAPDETQAIADQTLTYPALLNSTDVFSWVITNLGIPVPPGQSITFRGTISVQGTPV